MAEAPELFAYDSQSHCFFKRQPITNDEVDGVFRAVLGAELECLRYRGADFGLLRRFAELGSPHLCDIPPPPEIRPVVRDRVSFDAVAIEDQALSAADIARDFQHFLADVNEKSKLPAEYKHRHSAVVGGGAKATFFVSWYEGHNHYVTFEAVGSPGRRWVASHASASLPSGRGVSNLLHEWLRGKGKYCAIRWYSHQAPENWRPAPV
jgi:hypothetical protein